VNLKNKFPQANRYFRLYASAIIFLNLVFFTSLTHAQMPAFLPLGGASLFPSQNAQFTYSGWLEPNATVTNATEQTIGLQVPIFHHDTDSFSLSGGGSNLHFDQPPVLSGSNVQVPSDLNKVDLTGQFSRTLDGQRSVGARLSIGSASDHLFDGFNVTTITATATYSFPNQDGSRWILMAIVTNNSTILNYIPFPGFVYLCNTENFNGMFGFPFGGVRWMPASLLTLSAFYLGPSVNTEIAVGNLLKWQAFTGFSYSAQAYLRADRTDDRDHLYFAEKRATVGARWLFLKQISAEVSGGYAFDRSLYEEEQFLSKNSNSASIANSMFYQLNLKVAL
jgi:hypothetical protein